MLALLIHAMHVGVTVSFFLHRLLIRLELIKLTGSANISRCEAINVTVEIR